MTRRGGVVARLVLALLALDGDGGDDDHAFQDQLLFGRDVVETRDVVQDAEDDCVDHGAHDGADTAGQEGAPMTTAAIAFTHSRGRRHGFPGSRAGMEQ